MNLPPPKTKLEAILMQRHLSQGDLIRMIKNNTGHYIGRDRISRITTGKSIRYNLETAIMIANALGVQIEDIIELKVEDIKQIKEKKRKKM